MAFIGNFNAADIEPADFSALPAGDYTALITSSEFRNTKSGDGQYLVLCHQIVDGPKKGRMLWHNLNLINSNEKAVEIAQRELSAIARAAGVMQFDNSDALHNKPMRITVTYTPAGPDKGGVHREESNRIKKWESVGGVKASPVAATPSPTRPATAPATRTTYRRELAAPTAKTQPWKKAQTAPVAEPELEDDVPF